MEIKLKEIVFDYKDKRVIDKLTFTFEKGRTYALLGKSGIGKSTLLSLLKGFETPLAGTIQYDGLTESNIEIVFQDLQLFPWQTVYQTVEMPLKLKKVSKAERTKRVTKLLEELELSDLANSFPGQLSGGQQQRTAMARGLITEPAFLLLDEPTSSLDQETKERAQGFILSEQKKRGNTLITVTHDIEEAAFLGETILIMDRDGISVHKNPVFHLVNRRDSVDFYNYCITLRKFLKS
ncbi:ABC transporter ATP-binding protein [Enterococcus sp. LJL128]|uniref:ABC transporter ATP-binding protein n=1 Tax=Enterococcus sp. LJL51 TaxID=3416656 RepID=UPI003CFAD83F